MENDVQDEDQDDGDDENESGGGGREHEDDDERNEHDRDTARICRAYRVSETARSGWETDAASGALGTDELRCRSAVTVGGKNCGLCGAGIMWLPEGAPD